MKKALVILLALALVAGAFAQTAEPSYSVTADASVKWGIDLGTMKNGFINSYNFGLDFPLVAGATAEKSGEGVYGKISVTGIDLGVNDTNGTVTLTNTGATVVAKVIAGPVFFGIYSKPGFSFTNALYIAPYSVVDYASTSKIKPSITVNGGVSVGYTLPETLGTMELRVASLGDWKGASAADPTTVVYVATGDEEDETGVTYATLAGAAQAIPLTLGNVYVKTTTPSATAANDQYAAGFNMTVLPVSMLKLNLGAMYNFTSTYVGYTGKLTLTPMTDLSFVAAADGYLTTTSAMALNLDAYAKLAYAFNTAKDSVALEAYFVPNTVSTLDVAFKFADASGFVPGLSADLAVIASDVLGTASPIKLTIADKLSYKVVLSETTYVTPYQKAAYDLNSAELYLSVGASGMFFANTTLTLDYSVGSITADKLGNKFFSGKVIGDIAKGILSFTTKVSL